MVTETVFIWYELNCKHGNEVPIFRTLNFKDRLRFFLGHPVYYRIYG